MVQCTHQHLQESASRNIGAVSAYFAISATSLNDQWLLGGSFFGEKDGLFSCVLTTAVRVTCPSICVCMCMVVMGGGGM